MMLSNFVVSLEAVLPMFIMLAVGMGVKRFRLLTETELRHLNKMIFVVFFPPMMFTNLYGTDIEEAVDWRLMIFGIASVAVIYGVSTLAVLHMEKDPRSRGAMIQAIYRSNFVIMGIPIAVNMYGHGNLAVTAMMVAVIVPIYNVLAVVTLEVFLRRDAGFCRDFEKSSDQSFDPGRGCRPAFGSDGTEAARGAGGRRGRHGFCGYAAGPCHSGRVHRF